MSILMGILHQLCPRCGVGRIFRGSLLRGFPRMNERCPVCDLKFAREEGYFLGAMYISYGISVVVICLFAAVVWMLTRWSLQKCAFGHAPVRPFAPGIALFSRVLWIYLD